MTPKCRSKTIADTGASLIRSPSLIRVQMLAISDALVSFIIAQFALVGELQCELNYARPGIASGIVTQNLTEGNVGHVAVGIAEIRVI